MSYITGLDLGQTTDSTALVTLDKHGDGKDCIYDLALLERCPLMTPYPQIVAEVGALFSDGGYAGSVLAVDQTGVGRPVVDMFRQLPVQGWGGFFPITITNGHEVTKRSDGSEGVPKRDLITCAMVLIDSGRMRGGKDHPEWETLVKEMRNFRYKITTASNMVYEAWREGQHDDLLLALAMAAWVGENHLTGTYEFRAHAPKIVVPDHIVRDGPPMAFGQPWQPVDKHGRPGYHRLT